MWLHLVIVGPLYPAFALVVMQLKVHIDTELLPLTDILSWELISSLSVKHLRDDIRMFSCMDRSLTKKKANKDGRGTKVIRDFFFIIYLL